MKAECAQWVDSGHCATVNVLIQSNIIERPRNNLSYLGPGGSVDEPVSHFRVAVLTNAIALSVVFLALLLTIQPVQHVVKIDLLSQPNSQPGAAWNLVLVTGEREVALDGVRCADSMDLRMAIDFLMQREPTPNIRLQVRREVRHEYFLQILAVLKQADVGGLHLDTEPLPDDGVDIIRSSDERQAPNRPQAPAALPNGAMMVRASSLNVTLPQGGCAAQFGSFPMLL